MTKLLDNGRSILTSKEIEKFKSEITKETGYSMPKNKYPLHIPHPRGFTLKSISDILHDDAWKKNTKLNFSDYYSDRYFDDYKQSKHYCKHLTKENIKAINNIEGHYI